MGFGDWLRWKRSRVDMAGKELARLAGISQQYLSDIELGRRGVPVGLVMRLASALGASPDVACLRAGHLPPLSVYDIDDATLQRALDAMRAVLAEERTAA